MTLFASVLGVVTASSLLAQQEPDCGSKEVTFCASPQIIRALGLCDAVPSGWSVEETSCLDLVCDSDPENDPDCCLITIVTDSDSKPGCPDDPDPCPIGLDGLISQLVNSDNITYDPVNPSASEDEAMLEICATLDNCCVSGTDVHRGMGFTVEDAIAAFFYLYPGTDKDVDDLRTFFEVCGDDSDGSGCPDNPGPPPGPPDPPVWPNGTDPNDGPPLPDTAGGYGGNRGGRCEGIALTGSPSFELMENDPAECAGGSSIGIFDIDLYSGKWAKQSIDLALPAEGFNWIISRSYNGAQQENNGTELAPDYDFVHSNGMQGYNWRQDSLPELVENGDSSALYLVMNAQSYITFGPYGGSNTDLWVSGGSKGGAVVVEDVNSTQDSKDYEIYEVYDLTGLKMSFFGPKDTAIPDAKGTIRGQLWKIEDPDGNVAYVGHETDPGQAISDGFVLVDDLATDPDIYAVEEVFDTSGRLYKYAYSSQPIDEDRNNGSHRLTSVTVYAGGSVVSQHTAKVEYEYYDWLTWTGTIGTSTPESFGQPGDLKLVRVSTPASIETDDIVERTHYRYWEDSDSDGYDHAIKYIYGSEGLRRADIDLSDGDPTTDDVLSETIADLKAYAMQYMEYNDGSNDRRIKKVWGSGECGCGVAGGDGMHELTYDSYVGIMTPGDAGWQPWYVRTMIEFPPATPSEPNATTGSLTRWETHYFGLGGSRIATVVTDGDPDATTAPNAWVSLTEYSVTSLGASQYTPDAISSYDHDDGTFTVASSGLAYEYIPWSQDDAIDDSPDTIDDRNYGRTRYIAWKEGNSTSIEDYLSEVEQVFSSADITKGNDTVTLGKAYQAYSRRFPDGGTSGTGYEETEFTYTFHSGVSGSDIESLRLKTVEVDQEIVTTGENGDGTSTDPTTTYYRLDGTMSWQKEADGILSYTKYTDGVPVLSVRDADTTGTGVATEDQSGAPSETGTPLHIATEYTYDDQMRVEEVKLPHERKLLYHYDILDDGRVVDLSFPRYDSTGSKVYGPATFTVSGHNGVTYASGAVELSASGVSTSSPSGWVDQTDEYPSEMFAGLGTMARLSTTEFDEPGAKATETRAYYDIPSTGAGTSGTHYDKTTYLYDDLGRMVQTQAPHGTISRTTFDDLGRVVATYMGTNDSDFPGSSGTGDNMTKISATTYDGGNVGNGLVSKTQQFTDSSNSRDTLYYYDDRDRLHYQVNPEAPHSVYEYDNLDRTTHVATYDSSTNLSSSTVASTTTTDRVALSETMYDTRGRVYESRTYEIVQSTGAKAGGSSYLFSKSWYDPVDQVIKTSGRSLTKTVYDRLRRPEARYALSSTNDTGYSDADDVTGDYVVSETHTLWDDDSGLAMATMSVDRHPEDTTTTGALYTESPVTSVWDEEFLEGRARIGAVWYDEQDRLIQSVDYGTAGLDSVDDGETFDRLAASLDDPPDVEDLVDATTEDGHFVINEYNERGELEVVKVPNDDTDVTSGADWYAATKTVYDDMGRVEQRIENWNETDTTPALPDINRVTEMVYEDGLMVGQIAKNAKDNGGSPSVESQYTRYEYGSTKGAGDSDIATGHLLDKVYYPDATEESGSVSSGHTDDCVSYKYNAQSQRKETEDQAGNIIETDFDDRGRATKRKATNIETGFDNAVQRIETVYDDRGLVLSVKQYDDDAAGNLVDTVSFTYDDWGNLETSDQDPDNSSTFTVAYEHELSSGEISRLRRTRIDYHGTARVDYTYTAGIDRDLSRVSQVEFDPVSIAPVVPFTVDIAEYEYGGMARLMKTSVFDGSSTYHTAYYDTADTDGYAYLDRFSRPKMSYWAHGSATSGMKFYEVDLYYDVASNIIEINDEVTGRNQDLAVDDFRRLTSSTIGSDIESWDYDHLGNWEVYEFDDGDGNYDKPLEIFDERIFNRVNEITDRDISLGASPQTPVAKDPVYDAVGNMTDDGRYYEYTYDAFGRITQVDDDTGTVAKYRYNGLFQRVVTITDRDGDQDVSDEHEYHHVYDDRWRVIEIYRKANGGSMDTHPKEVTLYHAAGVGGSSSPLDSVIARWRSDDEDGSSYDPYTDWGFQADGEMDIRTTYFQNWRGDVVFIRGHDASERIEYTPYGVPISYSGADQNLDGSVNSSDASAFLSNYGNSSPLADMDFSGTLSYTPDQNAWTAEYLLTNGTTGGEGVLSPWLDNHIGYAGYRLTDQTLTTVWHVRFRELLSENGAWTIRDPIGYHDGFDLYEYAKSASIVNIDPRGLACGPCGCGQSCGDRNNRTQHISKRAYEVPATTDFDSCYSSCMESYPNRGYRGWTVEARKYCRDKCKMRERILRDDNEYYITCWRYWAFWHCEVTRGGCSNPGTFKHKDCKEYPIKPERSPGRTLPDGTACEDATDEQIYQCLMRRDGWSIREMYWFGDNCQAWSGDAVKECCARSPWKPSWYSGVSNYCYQCLEWEYLPGNIEGSDYRCKKWARNPWYDPSM